MTNDNHKPVAWWIKEDGTERPIYSWSLVDHLQQRDRSSVVINFDAWMQASFLGAS